MSSDKKQSVEKLDQETEVSAEKKARQRRLAEEVEYARKISDQERKKAPNVAVSLDEADLLSAKVKWCKDMGLVPDGFHVVWGEDKNHRNHVGAGKMPVVFEGEQVFVNEMEAFLVADELTERRRKLTAEMSRAALSGHRAYGDKSIDEIDKKMLPPQVRAQWEKVKAQRERLAGLK